MQRDKQFRVSGKWALASDGVQWIIQRQTGPDSWQAMKFIHSDKAWLAFRLRAMAPAADADKLLDGLPDTFDDWHDRFWPSPLSPSLPKGKTVMAGSENTSAAA
jgi:hypothetical protein